MNRQKILLIFTLCLLTLLTCGIDEYYYLPQVPESGIEKTFNTEASINIPSNLLNEVDHYATGYVIFYKIYISNASFGTIPEILNNNSRILSDYNAFLPYIDPSNATSIPSLATFSNRGYYELELDGANIRNTVLSKSGGTFSIQFTPRAGEIPFIEHGGNKYSLYRSNGGGLFAPKPDRYFRSSTELNDNANAIATINADVSGQSGTNGFAYTSMYIVTVGQNPSNFSRLYGKPTHINIFILTPGLDMN
jgi:hypothetical protein